MTASSIVKNPGRQRPTAVSAVAAVVVASVAAIVLDAVIAAVAHAAGASTEFRPLHLSTYAALTVIGIVAGAIGWVIIRARSRRPASLLRRLVPAVILVSFIPDLAVGIGKSQPGTSWGAVAALMVMHLAVAAAAVTAFRLLLPVQDHDR